MYLGREFHLAVQKLCTYFIWSKIWESHILIGILLAVGEPYICVLNLEQMMNKYEVGGIQKIAREK